jgi:pyrroline-5-carboxylate reductase
MFLSIAIAFAVSGCSAALFSFLFSKLVHARLYSLECDVADLQDRHLRAVRKAGAVKRWDEEEELDEKIKEVVSKQGTQPVPLRGRMKKWVSTSESSSVAS